MAFDKPTRNLLAKIVARCRDRLADDITDQLQSAYGLHPDGTVLDVARTEDDRRAAEDLRALWEHFEAAEAGSAEARQAAAYGRLVREIGFTLLNRLAALRLCEERGLAVECVRRGMASDGFQLYDQIAGGALGNRYRTYRAFLEGLFDELALDLGTPQSLVFPSEAALTDVLAWLNDPQLAACDVWQQDETIGWVYQYYNDPKERKAMRDASTAPRNSRELAVRNQFFTPRYVVEFLTDNTLGRIWYEMRRGNTRLAEGCRYLVRRPCEVFLDGEYVRRDAHPGVQRALRGDFSQLPEEPTWGDLQTLALTINGYDLAPALGLGDCGKFANARMAAYRESGGWTGNSVELWICLFFEQRRWRHFGYDPEGEDLAAIQTLYAALREALTRERDTSNQEELLRQPVYIPPRARKDPRDLKILDPACGSGHFLLYAFDLLTTIYEESWADPTVPRFRETGTKLADDHPDLEALRAATPGLILRHNLHGIDIDSRAVQIAALALWLRAQRAFQDLGLAPADRPRITRTNLVTAEPMPGDRELLDEFTRDLRPRVLGDLVRVVFEKMELAGEAGSLLKIEEELAEAIAEAHRQWAAGPQAEQMLLFPEDRRPQPEQLSLFDISGVTDATFWETAEMHVLRALNDYAARVENGRGMRRRLFAEDAAQGFAFVDLCEKQFDIVLMNPPFGLSSQSSKHLVDREFENSRYDMATAFVDRTCTLLGEGGRLGALCTRTPFFLSRLSKWREGTLLKSGTIAAFVDLGHGVLDSAMVEVAAFIMQKGSVRQNGYFFRLVSKNLSKQDSLLENVMRTKSHLPTHNLFVTDSQLFGVFPKSPFCYWAPRSLVRAFGKLRAFGNEDREAWVGLQTNDDFRWLRLAWEVPQTELQRAWFFFAKGGEFARFYSDLHLVVEWAENGRRIKEWKRAELELGRITANNSKCWNEGKYFRKGLTWTQRTTSDFSIRVLPEGCIFGIKGPSAFVKGDRVQYLLAILSMLSSSCFQMLLQLQVAAADAAARSYDAGLIRRTPFPDILHADVFEAFSRASADSFHIARSLASQNETGPWFILPSILHSQKGSLQSSIGAWETIYRKKNQELIKYQGMINDAAFALYKVPPKDRWTIQEELGAKHTSDAEGKGINDETSLAVESQTQIVSQLISWCVGVITGRFELRIAGTEPTCLALPKDPFNALPVCPPGMLVGPDGLPATPGNIVSQAWLRARPDAVTLPPEGSFAGPATIPDDEYPIHIAWDGVLVDDPGLNGEDPHPSDIVRRARQALAVLWPENHDGVEAEACEILGVRELRDYFRKPNKFFADHLKRYSKSRRKAPIYWPLSTASGSYTLWLYYHRLDDQILYTAVNRYVTPKIQQIEGHVARLEVDLGQATGRAASNLRDQLDDIRAFLAELRAFRAELLRVAGLPYKPDLNDGVIINAAPLHKLFRLRKWAQATEKVWRKLEAGEYDWAHMAYTLWPERVREVCKHDRSIAIAHGLEGLCEVPEKRSRKKGKG